MAMEEVMAAMVVATEEATNTDHIIIIITAGEFNVPTF